MICSKMKDDEAKVSALILDTLTSLCQNGLTFDNTLRIQGLIGITYDDKEVFIIQIDKDVTTTYVKPSGDHPTNNILTFNESSQVSLENPSVPVDCIKRTFLNKSKRKGFMKKRKYIEKAKSVDCDSVEQLNRTDLPTGESCKFHESFQVSPENPSIPVGFIRRTLRNRNRRKTFNKKRKYSEETKSANELGTESQQQQQLIVQKQKSELKNEDTAGWFDCNTNVSCSSKWIDEFKMQNQKGGTGFSHGIQGFNSIQSGATLGYVGNLEAMDTTKINLDGSPTTLSPITSAVQSSGFPMYRCPYEECGCTFLYKRSSDRHQRAKHGSIFGVTNQTTYICPHEDCGKIFYKPNSFARHQNCTHLKKMFDYP